MTEASYEPREMSKPPKEGNALGAVCTGVVVIVYFLTIWIAIQVTWSSMSWHIDVSAQLTPYIIASVSLTIIWIGLKIMDYKKRRT